MPADGPVPDVPEPTEQEIGFLLDVVAAAFSRPLHRSDVVGAYAGLRPLLDVPGRPTAPTRPPTSRGGTRCSRPGPAWSRSSAASSRRTAGWPRTPSTRPSPAPRSRPASAGPASSVCSAPRRATELAALEQPARLVRRFGTDAALVLANAVEVTGLSEDELLAPIADGIPVTLAELVFAITHEGAHDVGDLLDRRTRVGLVPADRERAVPAAERALALVGARQMAGQPDESRRR